MQQLRTNVVCLLPCFSYRAFDLSINKILDLINTFLIQYSFQNSYNGRREKANND